MLLINVYTKYIMYFHYFVNVERSPAIYQNGEHWQ